MGDILVGFRFHPTDQEIIRLLEEKRRDPDFSVHAIVEININEYEPSELTGLSPIQSDEKWYNFFYAPSYMNADTKRVNRATKRGRGYWKLTGEGCKIKAKRSNEVIGNKRILVFYERGGGGGKKEIKTDWVMHQFSMEKSDPLYKKDFVVCRIKKKGDKKCRVSANAEKGNKKRCASTNAGGRRQKKLRMSTNDKVEPSHDMAFDNGNFGAENTSPESELLVIENTSSESELFVTENTSLESQLPIAKDTSPESQLGITENTSTESQLLLSNCSVSDPRDDVAENTLEVNFQNLAKSNALDSCDVLDQSSFSPVQSSTNPEPGSSYSGASSNEDDILISLFGTEWEDDLVNQQWFVQREYPCEETRRTTLPHNLNSSESRSYGWDRSEMDSEAFGGWVNRIFDYNTMACVNP